MKRVRFINTLDRRKDKALNARGNRMGLQEANSGLENTPHLNCCIDTSICDRKTTGTSICHFKRHIERYPDFIKLTHCQPSHNKKAEGAAPSNKTRFHFGRQKSRHNVVGTNGHCNVATHPKKSSRFETSPTEPPANSPHDSRHSTAEAGPVIPSQPILVKPPKTVMLV